MQIIRQFFGEDFFGKTLQKVPPFEKGGT